MSMYEERRERLYDWMAEEGIALVMFEDCEGRRDPALRYFSGQPGDGVLFLSAPDRKALLAPWDVNMARLYARVEQIAPYTDWEQKPSRALKEALALFKTPAGSRVEIPSVTPYPAFLKFVEEIGDYDVICRESGAQKAASAFRAVKGPEEISLYREAAAVTNSLIDTLEANVRDGTLKTEADAALFIEGECRRLGCEGTSFPTLAAGSERSFGIHAFPNYTTAAFAQSGMSILDFGILWQGYATDVTMTFARLPLAKPQEKMLALVERAFGVAFDMLKGGAGEAGIPAREVALAVEEFFAKSKKKMPHGLGHGIGLEIHEGPFLRTRSDNDWVLRAGMIFTLEPGLYDPVYGGCRYENDVLLTQTGAEILTTSRIVRF